MKNNSIELDRIYLSGLFSLNGTTTEGIHIFTPLAKILQDARSLCNRDKTSGALLSLDVNFESHKLLGVIGYMIILETIGKTIKPKHKKTLKKEFISVFHYFADHLEEKEMNALYAFRCSLVHDVSLENKRGNSMLNHSFTYVIKRNDTRLMTLIMKEKI